jgi:hypothetical protein
VGDCSPLTRRAKKILRRGCFENVVVNGIYVGSRTKVRRVDGGVAMRVKFGMWGLPPLFEGPLVICLLCCYFVQIR